MRERGRNGGRLALLQVPVAARVVVEAAGELVERPPLVEEPAAVAERPSAPAANAERLVVAEPVDEAVKEAEAESAAKTPQAPANPEREVPAEREDEATGAAADAAWRPAAMPDGVSPLLLKECFVERLRE